MVGHHGNDREIHTIKILKYMKHNNAGGIFRMMEVVNVVCVLSNYFLLFLCGHEWVKRLIS